MLVWVSWLFNKINSDNPSVMDNMIKTIVDVKDNWNYELHDTKDVTSKVLEQLGIEWERSIDNLFPIVDYDNRVRKIKDGNLTFLFPVSGKDRTRILKNVIKLVLDEVYKSDNAFKYYKKYNPDKRQYIIWKNSKFN